MPGIQTPSTISRNTWRFALAEAAIEAAFSCPRRGREAGNFCTLSRLRQGKGLTTPESLGAFVNGVCNNVLFEVYRAQSRAIQLEDEHEPPDTRPNSAEHNMMAGEERGRVRQALSRLPDKEQTLLKWLFFEERSKDDICRSLNIDRNYLRVLLHRAKNHFRECLDDIPN